jgi:uncharacterized protein (DUF488 family)
MFINETDINFIYKLQSHGNDNVYLGGSVMMVMLGIRKKYNDIDIIIYNRTTEQDMLIKDYNRNTGKLDFLNNYLVDEVPEKNLRYKGIPIAGFEAMIRFKTGRAYKKDYIDMLTLIKWLITYKPEGINIDESILTIVDEMGVDTDTNTK